MERRAAHRKGVITGEVAELQLPPGIHEISVHAKRIGGTALMKLLEIQLLVANEKNK